MTFRTYEKIAEPFRRDPAKKKRLNAVNKWITAAVYAIYIGMTAVLALRKDRRIFRFLLIPAAGFVAVSAFRKVINAPRPYEVWEIEPLIAKDTKGKSFPSRHAFSIYMIAMAALFICPVIGIVLLIAGVLLIGSRVIAGVHFLKDVVAGALCGIGIGLVGFFSPINMGKRIHKQ